jgi:carbamoyl-phosphate synthase small subunit
MLARFVKPLAFKPTASAFSNRVVQQARFLATVEGSAGRAMPATRPRATPISHDRATLTIRVRPSIGEGLENLG